MPFQRPPPAFAHTGIVGESRSQPCHGATLGGDALFSESQRCDGLCLLLLIDVSGHGDSVAPTVELIETRLLVDLVTENQRPAELLRRLHDMLTIEFATAGAELFVAALALLIDGLGGVITAANAYNPLPLIGRAGYNWLEWALPPAPALAMLPTDPGYTEVVRSFPLGEQVLVFSDGITEAGELQGHQFRRGPFQAFLNGLPVGMPANTLHNQLWQAVQGHVTTNWPEDDTTLVALESV